MGVNDRHEGTIKWFNLEKAYGFIIPHDGGDDVFLHKVVLERSGLDAESLKENTRVSFTLREYKGKVQAASIQVIS